VAGLVVPDLPLEEVKVYCDQQLIMELTNISGLASSC